MPQECRLPAQDSAAASPLEDANTENFFDSFAEPQWGHFVPSQLLERTSISLSFSHCPQWNS
jgi:hypothetical protein